MSELTKEIRIPGLATVSLDTRDNDEPLVKIVLSDDYQGDLNDLEQKNALPDRVLFEGCSADAINDPDLAKFLEVLEQWDYDHDGIYDGDTVSDLIEKALWKGVSPNHQFQRKVGRPEVKFLMGHLPPEPERHIIYSFGELRRRRHLGHFVVALILLLLMAGGVFFQLYFLPFTRYSILSVLVLFLRGVNLMVLVPLVVPFVVGAVFMKWHTRHKHPHSEERVFSLYTSGFLNRAAVYEEQAFREGAEKWTYPQRIWSCFLYGLIHLTNPLYPIAIVLPMAIGGAIFMRTYLRAFKRTRFRRLAVLDAAVQHRVYNTLALGVATIAACLTLGLSLTVLGGLSAFVVPVLRRLVEFFRTIKAMRAQSLLKFVTKKKITWSRESRPWRRR